MPGREPASVIYVETVDHNKSSLRARLICYEPRRLKFAPYRMSGLIFYVSRLRRLACTLLLVLAAVGILLHAPRAAAQPGDPTGFAFLRLEPSARAASLGGAFMPVYDGDVNGIFYNPALLSQDTHRALSLSYLNHLAGLQAGFLAYSHHVRRLGTLGAGLRFLSWGTLQGADEQGNTTGSFSASDAALTLSLARPLTEHFRYGLSLHAIASDVGPYHATALAVDLGALYHFSESELTVSAALHNAGLTLGSLGSAKDQLPFDVRLGIAKRLQHLPLLFSLTGYNLQDLGEAAAGSSTFDRVLQHLAFGGELQLSKALHLRLGYNHRRHEALKVKSRLDLAGFGMGFGLQITRFHLDYAFNSWSSFGGLHQFTVRTTI